MKTLKSIFSIALILAICLLNLTAFAALDYDTNYQVVVKAVKSSDSISSPATSLTVAPNEAFDIYVYLVDEDAPTADVAFAGYLSGELFVKAVGSVTIPSASECIAPSGLSSADFSKSGTTYNFFYDVDNEYTFGTEKPWAIIPGCVASEAGTITFSATDDSNVCDSGTGSGIYPNVSSCTITVEEADTSVAIESYTYTDKNGKVWKDVPNAEYSFEGVSGTSISGAIDINYTENGVEKTNENAAVLVPLTGTFENITVTFTVAIVGTQDDVLVTSFVPKFIAK